MQQFVDKLFERAKRVAGATSAIALFAAMPTGVAQADELANLKVQLEALQSQVSALNTGPARTVPALRKGESRMTLRRGSGLDGALDHLTAANDKMPADRGYTVAISPSADLPAPVTEISVSGYVKADVIYDLDRPLGDTIGGIFNALPGPNNDSFRIHARQSRFRIKSKSETAIGQIRTLIEGDFFDGPRTSFRLRHAWGEWAMTPNWTFGAGQTWSTFMPLIDLPDTADFFGPAGAAFSRQGQVRLSYNNGPVSMRFAVENPNTTGTFVVGGPVPATLGIGVVGQEKVPDFTAQFRYTTESGQILQLNGVVGYAKASAVSDPLIGANPSGSFTIWGVIGTAQFKLGDIAKITLSGGLGDGAARYIDGADTAANYNLTTGRFNGRRYYNIDPSVSIGLTDTVSANLAYGFVDFKRSDTAIGQTDFAQTVHGNIVWRPVKQMKMAWEVIWAERRVRGFGNPNAVRGQFGAWFFF